jgi:trans-2,3-dihydro-3-hydroxyanthranilate isomerase
VPVRIFTTQEELPFAGHPTLGSAWVIRGDSGAAEVQLQLGVGIIPVSFLDRPEGAFGEMRQRDPEFGEVHDRQAIARATGLALEDIADDVPIQTVSTGLPFTIIPVRRLACLQSLHLDWTRASEYIERGGGKFFYFVCREATTPAARLHARMIFYNGEDPATGSAAGCCAAWAARYGVVGSGERVLIEQGLECHRPSQLFVSAERQGERVVNVRVGGYTALVLRGEAVL